MFSTFNANKRKKKQKKKNLLRQEKKIFWGRYFLMQENEKQTLISDGSEKQLEAKN